ncbi:magnesium transporter [Alkalihalophilus pseudofirmus]|uniref:magnesium transporter n=1 Tax=Alkalihalophilus pseudofirmus TaxID=79885 RepID=UPI00259B2C1D|nr:magnesium transporter [Alkalihalophilus pseudofirmus]WEG15136.1 magnesium transporter [Alkalihalophilus pseudofirmus]
MKKISFKNREEYTYYLFMYLKNKQKDLFREEFLDLHPTDQVDIFKQMSLEKRTQVYDYLSVDEFAELFTGLKPDEQKQVFTELDDDYAHEMLCELPADELTDFFNVLPEHITTYLLNKLDKADAENIRNLLSYNEHSAGSLMTTEYVKASAQDTVSLIIERLRLEGMDAETIYYIYIVDEFNKLTGVVSLRELLSAPPSSTVNTIMKEQIISVSPATDQEQVSTIIRDYNLLAVPVLTSDEIIIGIVTVDDVMDVIEEETTEDLGEFAAVKGALDLEVTALTATKKRLPWLILLLFIGLFTAGLIRSFEATLAEVAVLAIFIPMIADMAGNTGTQSLAVVVRGLALRKFDQKTILRLLKREAATGFLMGLVCGILASLIGFLIPGGSATLGIIIGVSLFITVLSSTLSGTLIPLVIHRLKVDPAVASGPFITTINDIIGLFVYFTIATSLLHYM